MNIQHTLVENLDAIAVVRKMVVNNVSLRRTIAVSEMLGWDDNKDNFKVHEVFRWNAEKDVYKSTAQSYLLKEIADQWGYSKKEINKELKKRKVILDYMVRRHIRTYEDVFLTTWCVDTSAPMKMFRELF